MLTTRGQELDAMPVFERDASGDIRALVQLYVGADDNLYLRMLSEEAMQLADDLRRAAQAVNRANAGT